MQHLPLSQQLAEVLESGATAGGVTLNALLARTEGRGLYLVIILLGLPFVAWVSPPGLSTVLGTIIALLAGRLALNRPPRLGPRLGDRQLPAGLLKVIRSGGVRFLRLLEKAIRPRRTQWMSWRAARVTHALCLVGLGLLLAMPLPSPPFYGTNAVPSYAIIVLAASMMEEDGVMIWCGYAALLLSVVYFALWADLILHYLPRWLHAVQGYLGARP
jgi:hypothetical protein